MSTNIAYDPNYLAFQDALRQAERLAQENADSHAVIYRRKEPASIEVGQVVTQKTRLFVRLAGDAAPEDAEVMTTVSRKPPEYTGLGMSLKDAVKHMVANLPVGIELADEVVIEYFPQKVRWGIPVEPREVFAFEFMSTEGLNIGTWIPSVSMNAVNFQTGFEGRGRIYSLTVQGRRSIRDFIDAALVTNQDPGECSEAYRRAWAQAEESLRNGRTHPDEVGPTTYEDEEMRNGYLDRLALERTIRMGREMNKAARAAAAPDAPAQETPTRRPRP